MPQLSKKVAIVSEKKMREMFDIFDSDNSGAIETKELGDVMKTLGFGELSASDLEELIAEFDADRSGKMEFDEFRYLLKKYSVERGSPDDIFAAFQLFAGHTADGRAKSFITLDDLIQVSKDIGEWPELHGGEDEFRIKAIEGQRKTLLKRLKKILTLAPEDPGKADLPKGFEGLSLVQWRDMVARADDKHHPSEDGHVSAMDAYAFHEKATYDVYEYEEPEAAPVPEGEQF